MRRPVGDAGSSAAEFTLVSGLLVLLFAGILQLGFVLHARNVLVAAAQEGARYGANADRGPAQAVARTREVVADALSPDYAARLSTPQAHDVVRDGSLVMEVTLTGPLPVRFLPAGPLRLTVRGHALEEG